MENVLIFRKYKKIFNQSSFLRQYERVLKYRINILPEGARKSRNSQIEKLWNNQQLECVQELLTNKAVTHNSYSASTKPPAGLKTSNELNTA